MEKAVKLESVIKKVQEFLDSYGYSESMLYGYKRQGIDAIRKYYADIGEEYYSDKHTLDFVTKVHLQYESGDANYERFRNARKVHEMLKEYHDSGIIRHKYLSHWKKEMPCHDFVELLRAYESSKLGQGWSEKTLVVYRTTIRQFLLYLESKGYNDLMALSRDDVARYIPIIAKKRARSMSNPLCALRSFLRFLFERHFTEIDLAPVLMVTTITKSKIKIGFSPTETNRILEAVDKGTAIGKRDYAMLLLAVYTGLRSIDVFNLKLQDIDWKRNEISITQRKTGKPLVLPMDNKVGNAIVEYILNGRPSSNSPHVFLRSIPPYTNVRLGSALGSTIVQKYSKIAGIEWATSERKGFHSFRRSLGSQMLSAEVPLHTISQVLGHANSNSTKPYLSSDFQKLKLCALPLCGIECGREGLA